MKDKTIAIYAFIDDLLIKISHKEPVSRKVFDSQIITTAIVAGMFYKGHMENAISFTNSLFIHHQGKSRFNHCQRYCTFWPKQIMVKTKLNHIIPFW